MSNPDDTRRVLALRKEILSRIDNCSYNDSFLVTMSALTMASFDLMVLREGLGNIQENVDRFFLSLVMGLQDAGIDVGAMVEAQLEERLQ